jgi:plastocyanin
MVCAVKIVTACTAISLTSSAAAYEAIDVTDGGAVRGHVQYVGRPPARAKLEITKNKRACGGAKGKLDESLLVNAGGGIANVVVHLAGISRGAALQPGIPNPTLDQRGCQFRPHVLIFPAGSTLDVLNSDRIEHRIHTYADENPSVHRTQPGFNTQIQLTFEKPELPIRVECDAILG